MRRGAKTRGGFTLVEMMVGLAVSAVALAGVLTVSVQMQHGFSAADYQMNAQNDQLRVLDYLGRDLRQATAVSILNANTKVTITVPVAQPGLSSLSLGPAITSLQGSTPPAATTNTASYYVEGGQFIRELNGAQTVIADTVDSFQVTRQGQFVTTSLLFTPRFSFSPTVAAQQSTRARSCVYLRNAPPAS